MADNDQKILDNFLHPTKLSTFQGLKIGIAGGPKTGKSFLFDEFSKVLLPHPQLTKTYNSHFCTNYPLNNFLRSSPESIRAHFFVRRESCLPRLQKLQTFSTCNVILIVVDCTNISSLDHMNHFLTESMDLTKSNHYPGWPMVIVVENKIDLEEQRVITQDEIIDQLSKFSNVGFFSVSAKTGENVLELFEVLVQSAYIHGCYSLSMTGKTVKSANK